ncbi:MAG TPA: glycosyltransferase family 4 protein [Steroidobacteraceae bacterium]
MASVDRRDWVIVCGGIHRRGGMDRANAALAQYLAASGDAIHLVAHDVDRTWLADARATVSIVPRAGGSYIAGEFALERRGRHVVGALRRAGRRTHLIANGSNIAGADVNWVHCVHHAWPCSDACAPAWFRLKNRATKAWARRRERRAIRSAALVVTNSTRTTDDVVNHLDVPPRVVHTVYLGSDPTWAPATGPDRAAARQRWCGADPARPLIAFVAALGHDTNKGIDTLLDAWARLQSTGWNASLVVAGPGGTDRWRRKAEPFGDAIRFVGQIDSVGSLLDAADLLVSPVRYEAYGLAAHEALCRGVPVVITCTAGVVERLPPEAADLLLPDPPTVDSLTACLQRWAASPEMYRRRVEPISRSLRAYTEEDMARRIVDLATARAA